MYKCTLNRFYRKISAATFEDGCQSPILKQETDGSMSFLTIPPVSYGRTRDLQIERRDSVASGLGQPGEQTPNVHLYTEKTGFVILEDSDLPTSGLSNVPDVHDNLTSDMNQSSLCFKIAKNFSLFSNAVSTTVLQVS